MNIGGVNTRQYKFVDAYNEESCISFVCVSDIQEEYRDEFMKWMYGCTVPLIPECENAVYSWDWERFYYLKTEDRPTSWD